MKKTFASILALIYLSSLMGAGLCLPCCGETPDICFSQEKSDCCKEVPGHVQAGQHLQGAVASFKIHPSSADICSDWRNGLTGGIADISSAGYFSLYSYFHPDKVPLFIRNCNFRI